MRSFRSLKAPSRGRNAAPVLFAIALLIALTMAVPRPSVGASAAYLTTSFAVKTPALQVTENGYQGVSITYNNTLSVSENVLVFGSILNSHGQTVSIGIQGSNVPGAVEASYFFAFPSVPHGTYVVWIFVTEDGVPVSVASSVSVTL